MRHVPKRAIAIILALVVGLLAAPTAFAASADEQEKPVLPTCVKEVFDAPTSKWVSETCASSDAPVQYKITVTMPGALDQFSSYPFEIVYTLPEGMEIDTSEMVVLLDSASMASAKGVTTTVEDGVLSVAVDDLKALGAISESKIEILYKATITDAGKKAGFGKGYVNRAHAVYPSDPSDPSKKSETEDSEAVVYTFTLEVVKTDASNGHALAGAGFSIRDAVTHKMLANDGTWVDTYDAAKCLFASGSDGRFVFTGLGPGKYEIVEVVAPDGYELPVRGISFELGADMVEKKITATVEHELAELVSADATTGIVLARMQNCVIDNPEKPDPKKKEDPTPSGTVTPKGGVTPSGSSSPFTGKSYGMPTTGDILAAALPWAIGIAVVTALVLAFAARRSRGKSRGEDDTTEA